MFSHRCTDGTVVELRVPRVEEVTQINARLSKALSARAGLPPRAALFAVDEGMFSFPRWHVQRPGEDALMRPLSAALDLLPADVRPAAFACHIDQVGATRAHRRTALDGGVVCPGCVVCPQAEHVADIDDTLVGYARELLDAVLDGRLDCHPAA